MDQNKKKIEKLLWKCEGEGYEINKKRGNKKEKKKTTRAKFDIFFGTHTTH